MRSLVMIGLASAMLAGCVAGPSPPRTIAAPAQPIRTGGLEAVMGATAQRLIAQFGNPDLDLREGQARKLQFLGPACVLDTYLYPPRGGRGEPTVTYIDARQPDGREMDRASCVAALIAQRQTR